MSPEPSMGGFDLSFLAGPPFGARLFDQVIRRLAHGHAHSVLEWGSTWQAAAEHLAERTTAASVHVAHGLAVPVAVGAALLHPPAALVLCNGPVRALDRVTATLARLVALPGGEAVMRGVLRPGVWLPWLRSSAGLRRAVVNPYVMDHDTVAALCGPVVSDGAHRGAVCAYLRSLRTLPEASRLACRVLVLFGDADPLYPAYEAAYAESVVSGATYIALPGGQHLHPVERPWEMADRVSGWLRDQAFRVGA